MITLSIGFLGCFSACDSGEEGPAIAPVEQDESLSGGENFTTSVRGENAFGVQGANLTSDQETQFVVGNSLFRSNWVTAPASVKSLDGVGPIMNAISCGGCHFKDGRAKPPESGNFAGGGLLFRLSVPGEDVHGGPLPDLNYGGQLQDKSILDVDYEGQVKVTYQEIAGQYPDGTSFSLRKPVYEFMDMKYGTLDASLMVSPRIAQQIPGLGLLEAVPGEFIESLADENDLNSDGISGKANYVWNEQLQQTTLGRFGWKASQPSIVQQVAGAFNGDMGITSSIFPELGFTAAQQELYGSLPDGGAPEIDDERLDKITTYIKGLAVPVRRDVDTKNVLRGKYLFTQLNCSGCHIPKMQTGSGNSIAALNNQTIRPYTDLLLHDMGDGLADNRPDYLATGSEWRTAPLWGLGMIEAVNRHSFLLHDGRARNIEEAILWHGGEAQKAKEGFVNLPVTDRDKVIDFIKSL